MTVRIGLLIALQWIIVSLQAQTTFKETESRVIIPAESSTLIIDKHPWKLLLKDKKGNILFREAKAPGFKVDGIWHFITSATLNKVSPGNRGEVCLNIVLDNSMAGTATIAILNSNAFSIKLSLTQPGVQAIRLENMLKSREEVYGFGEMWNGKVAQRGNLLDLWARGGTPDQCAYIPYYVTTSNYAYFLDYGGRVTADVGKTDPSKIVLEAPATAINVLLTSGNNIGETVTNYLKVTGMPVMPPRWSFKPWFWLMSDPDQPKGKINTLTAKGVVTAAKRFKELDIPASVTWLEPPWQTARNSFVPDTSFSKDFKAFVDQLHSMDLKVLSWTTPYTTESSPNWKAALNNGYLVKKSDGKLPATIISGSGEIVGGGYHYVDFTNPAAVKWWQGEINKALDYGIDGFKLDDGQSLPEDAILHGGKLGKHFHNSYAYDYNKAFYEVLDKRYQGDFLTITRAASAGANKYLTYKWPGDLRASFDYNGLPSTVYSSLSIGFSGFPFISTDIGGFERRPGTDTSWVRWAQFGAMLPGMQTLNMPWWFSKKASDHYRYLSWLHTDLVPYWMSLANEAHQTGAPICRPLVWSYQHNEKVWEINDQFTIGEVLMMAPLITGGNKRQVYLPKGNWYKFHNNEKITGGHELTWTGDLYDFPLYIKEGAIIPMEIQNDVSGFGTVHSKDYITIAHWPMQKKGSSNFILHDKEQEVKIESSTTAHQLQLKWSHSKFNYLFRIHWSKAKQPRTIITNGHHALLSFGSLKAFEESRLNGWFYDQSTRKLWIRQNVNSERTLNVRY